MNDRIIEIENYWTRIVRDTAEFQQIAIAENPEFNKMLECVYRVLNEGFINDLTEYGASRWEKILGLPVSPTATLEERKVAILTYLSVKLPYTWRVLKQMLVGLLGEGNFELTFDNDAQKITIALASTVEHLREQIDSLIERVVPQNLVFEYDNGLPIDFEHVEFLESTGTQYIDTLLKPVANMSIRTKLQVTYYQDSSAVLGAVGTYYNAEHPFVFMPQIRRGSSVFAYCGWAGLEGNITNKYEEGMPYMLELKAKDVYVNGEAVKWEFQLTLPQKEGSSSYLLFAVYNTAGTTSISRGMRCYELKDSVGERLRCNLLPALDPTGAPCLFDTVTRKPFYNRGTGEFLYPTDAAPAVSADLDKKLYAKLTEHGVRRLYHVPKGYTGSKDEYAAEHGFKELVEPPMPQEGYWVPEWRETDTQLICEWVETEPPMEVTENE